MKLQDKVSTVDQSRKLKELGLIQGKTERYWYTGDTGNNVDHLNITNSNFKDSLLCFAAPDVAELGIMLPCESGIKFFSTFYNDHLGIWNCEFRGFKSVEESEEWDFSFPPPVIYDTEGDTEAEARAEMIIWLLENKIVSPDEINISIE